MRVTSLLSGAVLAGVLMASPAMAQRTLSIAVFGGVWQTAISKGVVKDFEDATGAKVVMQASAYNEMVAKLRASGGHNPPYDLVPLNPYAVAAMSAAKLIEPLDTSKIADYGDISPALLKQMTQGGQVYALPFSIGQLVLAYRTDMNVPAPTSWLDLFNPKYASCGVAALAPNIAGGGPETLSALAKAVGGTQADPATMDKVFQAVTAGKKNITAFPANTADMSTVLQRGEACLGPLYDGRVIELRLAKVPLALSVPKEGSVASMNGYVIATGTQNEDLAYKFLSFVANPKDQAVFADTIYYVTSNLKTPYNQTFEENRPDKLPDFDNMIWMDANLLAQNVTNWQYRWESIFH